MTTAVLVHFPSCWVGKWQDYGNGDLCRGLPGKKGNQARMVPRAEKAAQSRQPPPPGCWGNGTPLVWNNIFFQVVSTLKNHITVSYPTKIFFAEILLGIVMRMSSRLYQSTKRFQGKVVSDG